MKTLKYIFASVFLSAGLFSCTNEWDSHYSQQEKVVNNVEVEIVDEPASSFLQGDASYSAMYNLFDKTGVLQTLEEKGLLYTIMVVNNDLAVRSADNTEDDNDTFLANSHITDASISPSNLKDGQRLLMWNGKYVNVTTQNPETGEEFIAFNGSKVKKVIKTQNAYIYELDSYINTPKSLMEVLESLGDNYSIFRDMVLARTEKVFDKSNSTPIGIDQTGNTVYDSVFTTKSTYFANKKMDLYSESMHATMLIPSNELVEKALADAKDRLRSWNMERADSILTNWIFQSAFFNKEYKKEDFENTIDPDLYSIFDKQWRTTINKVDTDNPVEMSNGVAYYVKSLKIPTNNVLIWRVKEFVVQFNSLTEAEKAEYYPGYVNLGTNNNHVGENVFLNRVKYYNMSNQPNPSWPEIRYEAMMLSLLDNTQPGIFEFKFYHVENHEDGSHTVTPHKLPPGEYTLGLGCYGSRSNVDADFYVNDVLVAKMPASIMKGISWDRGGGGYNEIYSSVANYDRDGTTIGTVTITGDEPQEINIRVEFRKSGRSEFEPFTWCFRPTINCY